MNSHDPYTLMIAALDDVNDVESDERRRESFRLTRDFVKGLREGYSKCPCEVDYSNAHYRAAYLFTYYPHYIEPLYHALSRINIAELHNLNMETLRVCMIGAGAAPELLGLLLFTTKRLRNVERVKAYLLDKYVNHWRTGQDITRYHLAPLYAPETGLVMNFQLFDVLDAKGSWNNLIGRYVNLSRLFVMQNALNDQLSSPRSLLANMKWLFEQMPAGSVFIIIDVMFEQIKRFMLDFEREIVRTEVGRVLVSADKSIIKSNIEEPNILLEELLIRKDGLIPKEYTRFYSSVFLRT